MFKNVKRFLMLKLKSNFFLSFFTEVFLIWFSFLNFYYLPILFFSLFLNFFMGRYVSCIFVSFLIIFNLLKRLKIIKKVFDQVILDQETITNHLENDFFILNLIFKMNKLIAAFIILVLFCMGNSRDNLFMGEGSPYSSFITICFFTFFIILFFELIINIYIIYYKNHPVSYQLLNACLQCTKFGVVSTVGVHILSGIPLIEPNVVTDWVNINSPAGPGFTHRSSADRLKTSLLRSGLVGDFDHTKIIDSDKVVNLSKLNAYSQANRKVLKANLSVPEQVILKIF
jgi:hypothetical protein